MMLELMYGTIPSEKIPSLEMLPPVSVSTYPIIPPLPANDSANAVLSTPLIGMYVPTLDNTNSANTVAIFPGSFPLKKSPICTSPPPPPRPDDIARVAFGLVAASKTASNVPSSPTAASTIPNGSNVAGSFAYAPTRTSLPRERLSVVSHRRARVTIVLVTAPVARASSRRRARAVSTRAVAPRHRAKVAFTRIFTRASTRGHRSSRGVTRAEFVPSVKTSTVPRMGRNARGIRLRLRLRRLCVSCVVIHGEKEKEDCEKNA